MGRSRGNSRNGVRSKTVLTEAGPVRVSVPRDRVGSFTPKLVPKHKLRLTGVEDLVVSLSAKGLTTGEVSAHLDAQVEAFRNRRWTAGRTRSCGATR